MFKYRGYLNIIHVHILLTLHTLIYESAHSNSLLIELNCQVFFLIDFLFSEGFIMSTLVLQFKQLSQNVLMPFLEALCPKCWLETSLGLASLLPCGLGHHSGQENSRRSEGPLHWPLVTSSYIPLLREQKGCAPLLHCNSKYSMYFQIFRLNFKSFVLLVMIFSSSY